MTDPIHALLAAVPQYRGRNPTATRLTGGLTNPIFRIEVDGESHVLRVLSKSTELLGINRDHEHACTRTAAELGIGPDVIHYALEDGILVVRFAAEKAVSTAEAREPEMLARIVDVIRRFHEGPGVPGNFCPFGIVREYHRLAEENGVQFPDSLPRALEVMGSIETALTARRSSKPCHNDLLAANFLDDGERIWIIDWEYGGMGDPFFDLGNFCANQELDDEGERLLLELYFGEVRTADRAHLQLMKLASDLREALWGFLQSGISELDEDYIGYGTKHLERFLARAASPGLDAWVRDLAG